MSDERKIGKCEEVQRGEYEEYTVEPPVAPANTIPDVFICNKKMENAR